jgi:putative ABC transport system ATP-binding protein
MNKKQIAVKTNNLTKAYGEGNLRLEVLKGIDMTVNQGEYIAIMGKSGAGKSTLLYQISLLDKPTTGTIELLEQEVSGLNEAERTSFRLGHLGYIFQDYALVPELTASENVELPLMMLGWDSARSRQAAHAALDSVGLADKHNNRPNQLSGGQQQRVSIARAIAKNPEILFADEPTANLDGASSEEVLEVMKKLSETGQTIVMITHEREYTRDCDRVLWMEDGLFVDRTD